jgi:hypothetical protein
VLVAQLEIVQKALSKEKSSRSAAEKALAEERDVQKVVEHALKKFNEELSQKLKIANTSLTATHERWPAN